MSAVAPIANFKPILIYQLDRGPTLPRPPCRSTGALEVGLTSCVFQLHAAHDHFRRHIGQRLAAYRSGKNNSPVLTFTSFRRIATVHTDKGTRCSLPAIMRFADTVQILFSKSASSHRIPTISPDFAAVRMQSFNARVAVVFSPRSPLRNAATSSKGMAALTARQLGWAGQQVTEMAARSGRSANLRGTAIAIGGFNIPGRKAAMAQPNLPREFWDGYCDDASAALSVDLKNTGV